MRKVARLLVAAVVVLVPWVSAHAVGAQEPAGEHIQSYDVAMTIERDGTLRIVETITYNFGDVQKHGIARDLVQREHFDRDHDRRYKIHVEGAVDGAGTPVPVQTSTTGPYLHVRIGDPNKTVTGVNRYVLTYTVLGAPKSFADHDELYWDAIGNQWTVPIYDVTVTVAGPVEFTKFACFSGPPGSFVPCGDGFGAGNFDAKATFTQRYLAEGSGLTIVVAMPKGTIQPPPQPIIEKRKTFVDAFAITKLTTGLAGGLALLGVALVVVLATRRGRDRRYSGSEVDAAMGNVSGDEELVPILHRERGPVEYIPPENIRPGQVGTLVDEQANLLDVTASIVDLAVRGFLTIAEVEPEHHHRHPDYELTATPGKGKGTPLPYEQLLLHELFDNRDSVKLSDLKYKFRASLAKIQDAMYDDTVAQGWYRIRPDRTRGRWVGLGVLVLALGIGLTALIAYTTSFGLVPLALVVTAIALLIAAGHMPARTAKGTAMLSRVRGFRRLFDEGEEDVRAHFAEQHDIFSQYLPFAIVFGCTKKWAKTFEGLAAEQVNSGWYVGSRPFDALVLANAVDHFGTAATGSMYASMPSSSGSSGFSGGFSGGGGGGGGGGSW
jgi:uncharacterized protein (TIGR04222 family)